MAASTALVPTFSAAPAGGSAEEGEGGGQTSAGKAPAGNGSVAGGAPQGAPPKTDPPVASPQAVAGSELAPTLPPAQPPAAEMPQTAAIPKERRKARLLDRITGLGKA
jgi:hypothetical protein